MKTGNFCHLLTFLFLSGILNACWENKNSKTGEPSSNRESVKEKKECPFCGFWVNTVLTDSMIDRKTVHELYGFGYYRHLFLEITEDSIFTEGGIGPHWYNEVVFAENEIRFRDTAYSKEYEKIKIIDSLTLQLTIQNKTVFLVKHNEFKAIIDTSESFNQYLSGREATFVSRYLSENIIDGHYSVIKNNCRLKNLDLKSTVEFKKNRVTGFFKDPTEYFADNYYGTQHTVGVNEILFGDSSEIENFAWKFRSDTLILTWLYIEKDKIGYTISNEHIYLKKSD